MNYKVKDPTLNVAKYATFRMGHPFLVPAVGLGLGVQRSFDCGWSLRFAQRPILAQDDKGLGSVATADFYVVARRTARSTACGNCTGTKKSSGYR